jgi:predicted protein tyrosine phosphatase
MIHASRYALGQKHGVLVLGQKDAVNFKPEQVTSLIRIKGWNPTGIYDFQKLMFADDFHQILELQFDDLDRQVEKHNRIIDDTDVEKILDFFEMHDHLKTTNPDALLLVHCQGGISRSSAVACAYGYWLENKEIEEDIRYSGWAVPNGYVYRLLVKAIEKRRWDKLLA